MKITILSSREFNQDTSRAKQAADRDPVFITDRGSPAHVLLSIDEYLRLTGGERNLLDQLGLPEGVEEVELEIPRFGELAGAAELSCGVPAGSDPAGLLFNKASSPGRQNL